MLEAFCDRPGKSLTICKISGRNFRGEERGERHLNVLISPAPRPRCFAKRRTGPRGDNGGVQRWTWDLRWSLELTVSSSAFQSIYFMFPTCFYCWTDLARLLPTILRQDVQRALALHLEQNLLVELKHGIWAGIPPSMYLKCLNNNCKLSNFLVVISITV